MIWPNGFFKARTLTGSDAGLGFHCERCHVVCPHDCPESVFHCGALEHLDKKSQLPSVTLGTRAPAEAKPFEIIE